MNFARLGARIVASLLFQGIVLHAQPARIAGAIDSNQRVQLPGTAPFPERSELDRGLADPSLRLSYVTIYTKLTAQQQRELNQLLGAQQDRFSPSYRQWLTPEQYADRFGLNPADFKKLETWLQSEGFTIRYKARGRNWIAFNGTAGQIARSFHTEIHRYEVGGVAHFANATRPFIPAALDGILGGIRGLNDFHPKPLVLGPRYSNGSGNYLAPGDIATIYDLNPLYNAGIDGTGQTLAISGQSDVYQSDIAAFRTAFGLSTQAQQTWPNCSGASLCMLLTGDDPGVTGDLAEGELDLEWSGAVARNATIVYAYSDDAMASAFYAIDNAVGSVLSNSYGICEAEYLQLDDGSLEYARTEAQQANSQGMTWLTASGDAGPAACDWNGDATGRRATQGLAVNVPASIPEVTAVGGTEFAENGGSYWNPAAGSNGGTAESYIPEMAWNDTSFGTGLSRTLLASGGGVSTYYPVPEWQSGSGFPNDGGRDVPDLALSASSYHDAYVLCYNNISCFDRSGDPNTLTGGTSASTPIFAGVVTLLNQYLISGGLQTKAGLGNINPTLYVLAETSGFHDIVSGSNIVPCQTGTPDCSSGSFGYDAGPGYDEVTGLGSIDAYNLFDVWGTLDSTYTISGTVTLSIGSTSQALSGVTVTLTGSQASSVTTNSSGAYSFSVMGLGNYTLTPSLTGYTFSPSSLTFDSFSGSETANFIATTSIPLAAPFGSFDTPVTGSSINGSVGFTGWALSPAGISSVDIWREANPGEAGPGDLIYIGTAISITGSRPDVQALYPNYPQSNSSGWGLMILTNELPANDGNSGTGNGTYRMHALAHDLAGQTTDLGVKTVVVDNKDSIYPFGTIDTPTQGGTVSGSDYVNFGWALAVPGKMIPISGATIVVYIDNLPVGHPVYNLYRVDVANAFPGYANSQGAVGYYRMDTTKLADGIHTISWSVTDNAGVTSGVGSRFFIVQN